jgi:hypothetical protein
MLRVPRIAPSIPLLVLMAAGCFNPTIVPPDRERDVYAEPTAPESLIVNLQVSYRRREIGPYARILAPEFTFKFQDVDRADNGEFWTFTEDSTGTEALFDSPLVGSISIQLEHLPPEEPSELGFDPDVKKVRINFVQLEVDQVDGTTLLVTDLQDMYFRPGRVADGEDPERWFLLEWRDIPSAGAPRLSPLDDGTMAANEGTRFASWGAMLAGAQAP